MKNKIVLHAVTIMICSMWMVTSAYGADNSMGNPDTEIEEEVKHEETSEDTEQKEEVQENEESGDNEDASAYASVSVYEWELITGDVLHLPGNGEILAFDDTIFRLQEDAGLLASACGETEIVVRYRVKITQPPSKVPPEDAAIEELPAESQEGGTKEIQEGGPEEFQAGKQDELQDEPLRDVLPQQEENGMNKKQTEQEQKPDDGMKEGIEFQLPELTEKEQGIQLLYDKRYQQETVPSDFEPVIQLPENTKVEIVSCSVNGVEESYAIHGNQLVIDNGAITEGKNRVVVTVKDAQGNLSVMEPWEFMVESEAKPSDGKTQKNKIVKKDEKKEQHLSLGMSLLLVGATLVYYEKKKYLNKNEKC